ncbi:lysophospholipid acyltransferase family protein [Pedosphaera parvula]|uniref:Lipid A biosynthesis acyltransferase n=1 Tax=Pedosphaera parvula (strain Ellin514) TaxID=320771 RepID=B9XQ74_PEDPL|nr:lipid A biosynthesis acyltransferase [Pedosphaera parvula]EEF57992.1 lipid A biosynthesis acyltransferase [Pedosphaera parvula Ellin514]
MNFLLYYIARGLIGFLQALPITWVAHTGRAGGGLFYYLDARHRRVAIKNISLSFPEKPATEVKAIAKENFRRIGENWSCAIKTAAMTFDQLKEHMQVVGVKKLLPKTETETPTSRVFAIGHFGNFELFAHAVHILPWYQGATTYRAIRNPAINKLVLSLREQTGCLFFERRMDGAALREATRKKHLLLGLLSDQHAGNSGMRLPFLGRDCSTTKAPAVFAMRYNMPLHVSICFRTRPGYWRIEVSDEIPTREFGESRTVEAIMRDVNSALEEAVRRDPANWFWVHNRWKPAPQKPAQSKPEPEPEMEGEDAA